MTNLFNSSNFTVTTSGTVSSVGTYIQFNTSGGYIIGGNHGLVGISTDRYVKDFLKICEDGEVIFRIQTEDDVVLRMNVIRRAPTWTETNQVYEFDDTEDWIDIPEDYESILLLALQNPNPLLITYLHDLKQHKYDENIQLVYKINGDEHTISIGELLGILKA